jgi:hypothetical protein
MPCEKVEKYEHPYPLQTKSCRYQSSDPGKTKEAGLKLKGRNRNPYLTDETGGCIGTGRYATER